MRSDKRKDRVEVSPEQSAAAAAEAEKITEKIKKTTRVVGWYHSHPHITVNPSHVDVNTQAEYQKYMDAGFVGLIFSCFNTDSHKRGRVQVIGFQSLEENVNDTIDVDDASAHRNMMGSGRYYPREIPIMVVSSSPATCLAPTLQKIVSVQEILYTEERQEFMSFTQGSTSNNTSFSHPLATFHAEGVYQKALCRLLENGCAPIAFDMDQRVKFLQAKAARLKEERDRLAKLVKDRKR